MKITKSGWNKIEHTCFTGIAGLGILGLGCFLQASEMRRESGMLNAQVEERRSSLAGCLIDAYEKENFAKGICRDEYTAYNSFQERARPEIDRLEAQRVDAASGFILFGLGALICIGGAIYSDKKSKS